MQSKNPLVHILIVLSLLVAASLACNLPGKNASTLPPTAQPMTSDQIQNLEQQIQATLQSPNASGDVTVTITQDQLNGIITAEMAKQQDQIFTDPSVKLTNGHMEVYGKVSQSGISADTKVVLQPIVDANGIPTLNIISISLGGIPVPDALKNRLATMTDTALSDYLGSNTNNFKAKSIDITEGQMTITGTVQKP